MSVINRNQKIVREATLALFTILLFNACSRQPSKAVRPDRAIRLIYNLPILNLDEKFVNYTDSFDIFYWDSLVLYRFPTYFDSTWVTFNDDGEIIDEKLLKTETRMQYFIYRRGAKRGQLYRPAEGKYLKLSVDSFRAAKLFAGIKLYDAVNDSLISSGKLPDGNIYEVYLPKVKYDESYNDTTFFYYTGKLKGVEFSLSPELDSIKGLKLYKARLFFRQNAKMPDRNLYFELKALPDSFYREVGPVFNQLRKEFY